VSFRPGFVPWQSRPSQFVKHLPQPLLRRLQCGKLFKGRPLKPCETEAPNTKSAVEFDDRRMVRIGALRDSRYPKVEASRVARHTASYGWIGMHQTLLSEGRGRAPTPWAIIRGLNRTGATAFLLEQAANAGGIVAQIQIPIDATETATTLSDKARMAHIDLGARLRKRMATRALSWIDQDKRLASTWPRRRPEDGRLVSLGRPPR
jgi:hypothetical protein